MSPASQDFSKDLFKGYYGYTLRHFSAEVWEKTLADLGISHAELVSKGWVDADFLERFHKALFENMGSRPCKEISKFSFSESGAAFFIAFVGFFVSPSRFFKILPKGIASMNRYSKAVIRPLSDVPTFGSGVTMDWIPRDSSRTQLNHDFCLFNLGSIEGTFEEMGMHLLELSEAKCVRRGDSYCEVEIAWIDRAGARQVLECVGFVLVGYLALVSLGVETVWREVTAGMFGFASVMLLREWRNRRRVDAMSRYQRESIEALRESHGAMEQLTRELERNNSELQEVMALASVGENSYGYIHDMATPTTLVASYVEQLDLQFSKGSLGSEEIKKYIGSISRASRRLVALQNLIRSSVRNDLGGVQKSTPFVESLVEVLDLFEPFLEQGGITLVKNFSSERSNEIFVSSAEGAINAIFVNLFQNAISAIKKKTDGRKLILGIATRMNSVQVDLWNSGPPIPEARRASLFDRFGSSSKKPDRTQGEIGGTGFGLYHVKKMVESLNGTIEFLPSEHGTKFRLIFPSCDQVEKAG